MGHGDRPTARIVEALEQLERERDGAPYTIPFSGHASSAGNRLKAAPPQPAGETSSETIRVWRRDEAHLGTLSGSDPRTTAAKTPRPETQSEEESAGQFRIFQRHYGHHLQDVVDVLVLALGWKAQKTGWVSVHLMDQALDPGVILGLAAEVAERSDEPVLVIDGDMRNSALTRRLGVNLAAGLAGLLPRGVLSDEAILKGQRISFLPAGTGLVSLPAWLECRRLFDGCRQRYGLTLVYFPLKYDNFLPKLLRASDEAWLWCVKDRTPKHTVRQITEIIRGASCPLSASVLMETVASR